MSKKSFALRARAWATRHKLFGPQAFLRYVMFTFVEALNRASNDFVLKGGNLLWCYIKTPRATVDLDMATTKLGTDSVVQQALETACGLADSINFELKSLTPVSTEGKKGATALIGYKTDQGASNVFTIDIVYKIPTDFKEILSPIDETQAIKAATFENIVADKLAALHRFKGGNTRLKDLDDLWRLTLQTPPIRTSVLSRLLKDRKTPNQLDPEWINVPMERAWTAHVKRYKDLPPLLLDLFSDVNRWLQSMLN